MSVSVCVLYCCCVRDRPSLHSFETAAAAVNRDRGRGITREEVKARLLHELSAYATSVEPAEAMSRTRSEGPINFPTLLIICEYILYIRLEH